MNVLSFKIVVCTGLALLAFAGNSILCRLALGEESIDAASFTVIRLLSGIVVLALIVKSFSKTRHSTAKGSWLSAVMLFLYAVTFSFGYITLETGTGALILFGSVQITMILMSLVYGNKLHYLEWLGTIIAFLGFVYLVGPSVNSPSLLGFLLMAVAGIAWAVYTLSGRGSVNPMSDTAYNFLRTLPFIIVLLLVTFQDANLSQQGVMLAVVSGAIASGVGYAIWYIALGGLSIAQAAVLQLFVPVIAAIGGVIFASEMITLRLTLASLMVLGGILLVLFGRYYFVKLSPTKP